MCGIAVALRQPGVDGPPVDEAALHAALHRRGPDAFASWTSDESWSSGGIAVWASRLVLWDEGNADQPYVSNDGLVAVFNGELFNLHTLCTSMGMEGASEVEVLTRGIREHGLAFLSRIDGQFAGVVIDQRTGRTTAFRDRFGICPLYYAVNERGCVLASDLQAVAALDAGLDVEWSAAGMAEVLCEWAAVAPSSPWTAIRQIGPGVAVCIERDGSLRESTWATPWRPQPDRSASTPALTEAIRRSVRDRTRSVGAIAVSLSGGIDSTIVAALATEVGIRRSFGLTLATEPSVERQQRAIVDILELEHDVLELQPADVFRDFVEFVSTRRVPMVRLGPIGMMGLARFVRGHGCTSILCGEGADELFCGYDSYRVLAARDGQFGAVGQIDWTEFGAPEFGAGRGPAFHAAYWRSLVDLDANRSLHRRSIVAPLQSFLGPALHGHVARRLGIEPERSAGRSPIEQRRHDDLVGLLPAYLLTVQGDHAWMEQAVEQRPPWLANDVAELALTGQASGYLSPSQGKLPVRAVLRELSRDHPRLAEFDADKAAFRVDCSLFLADPGTWDAVVAAIGACPTEWIDVPAVLQRATACARARRCSEQESMLLLFAASLGILTTLAGAP